jgi:hypothetical protein
MTISQELGNGTLYFQHSIPDIILINTDVDTTVTFELKKGAEVIISEKYVFDTDGNIRIRNLSEIVEKYFTDSGLLLDFSYTITQGVTTHSSSFSVLKCEANVDVIAGPWTQLNFLTRAFMEKRTAKTRNEYLSFLQRITFGAVTVHYKAYYLVDSVITEKTGVLQTIAASAVDRVTTFNASLGVVVTVSGLALSTTFLSYDIWLTGTDFLTSVYTFLVDNTTYRYSKSFVYINSFGVLETFTATGLTVNKKTNEFNLGNIENHYRKITQDFVSEKTCNSGYLSDVEMEWIDDLVKSYSVGLYTPGVSGMSEEITLVGVEKSDSEANELQAFTFNYRGPKIIHLIFENAAKGIFDETFDESFE